MKEHQTVSAKWPDANTYPTLHVPVARVVLRNIGERDLLITYPPWWSPNHLEQPSNSVSALLGIELAAMDGAELVHGHSGVLAEWTLERFCAPNVYKALRAGTELELLNIDLLKEYSVSMITEGTYSVQGYYSNWIQQDTVPPIWCGSARSRVLTFRVTNE